MQIYYDDHLAHYGVGHLDGGHSGRYPWGSGKAKYNAVKQKAKKKIKESYDKSRTAKMHESGKAYRNSVNELNKICEDLLSEAPNDYSAEEKISWLEKQPSYKKNVKKVEKSKKEYWDSIVDAAEYMSMQAIAFRFYTDPYSFLQNKWKRL